MKKILFIILGIIILSNVGEAQRRRIGIETPTPLPSINPDGRIGRFVIDFGLGFGFGGASNWTKIDSAGVPVIDESIPGNANEFKIKLDGKYPLNRISTLIGGIEYRIPKMDFKDEDTYENIKYTDRYGISKNLFLINIGIRLYL